MQSGVSGSNIKVEETPNGLSEAEQLALLSYEAFQPGSDQGRTHQTDSSARKTLIELRQVVFVQQREFKVQRASRQLSDPGAIEALFHFYAAVAS
ncbi:hypothetical protein JCM10450v2_002181 [Rhodotorula kratochvilovae]